MVSCSNILGCGKVTFKSDVTVEVEVKGQALPLAMLCTGITTNPLVYRE